MKVIATNLSPKSQPVTVRQRVHVPVAGNSAAVMIPVKQPVSQATQKIADLYERLANHYS